MIADGINAPLLYLRHLGGGPGTAPSIAVDADNHPWVTQGDALIQLPQP